MSTMLPRASLSRTEQVLHVHPTENGRFWRAHHFVRSDSCATRALARRVVGLSVDGRGPEPVDHGVRERVGREPHPIRRGSGGRCTVRVHVEELVDRLVRKVHQIPPKFAVALNQIPAPPERFKTRPSSPIRTRLRRLFRNDTGSPPCAHPD